MTIKERDAILVVLDAECNNLTGAATFLGFEMKDPKKKMTLIFKRKS